MKKGERIRARREAMGLSQTALADLIGESKQTLYKYESGIISNIPSDKIESIASALKVSPAWIMGWDEAAPVIPAGFEPIPEMSSVPRVGRIACGAPILAEENIEAQDSVPAMWHADFTLLCVGESMEPKIKDGDLVAIKAQPEVENGEIAAVRIDCEATLKRVFVFPDHIELRAENPAFPTIIRIGEAMNDVHIEGKAVGLCRGL